MCGRFTFAISPELLSAIFGVPSPDGLVPRYNIAPTQQVLAIRKTGAGNRAVFMRWGLIPSWANDPSIGNRLINARSESVHDKPAFRNAIRHRRCIIPASGFFEWKEEGGRRQPFYVRPKDAAVMGLAGIWELWDNPGGEPLESCSILTTSANDLLQSLHDRMPVILQPGDHNLWLDREVVDRERLGTLYRPYPASLLEVYPVSPFVNNPRNDSPACIEPLSGGEERRGGVDT